MDFMERFRRAMGHQHDEDEDPTNKYDLGMGLAVSLPKESHAKVTRLVAEEFKAQLMVAAVVALTHNEVTWFKEEPKGRVGVFEVCGEWVAILSMGSRKNGDFCVIPLQLAMGFAKDEKGKCAALPRLVALAEQHVKEEGDGQD